jgi:hypothetical protein
MTNGGARRLDRLVLLAAPAALLATAAWMRAARGPGWLAFNFDPTYAYLLNSLTILEGYPPFLIHHPGMPLQALGSIVMTAIYAATGQGGLAPDVIARPETYIAWIHGVAAVVAAGMTLAAGVIAWRSAGLAAALLVQSGPWLSIISASLLGQMRAELLIAGTASVWAALVVAHAAKPASATPIRLGATTGVTLALHMSSLPLPIGALLVFDTWRDRRRLAYWTAVGFLIAFAPGWLKLPSFAKHMFMIAVHSGSYGGGPATIANIGTYLPSLASLVVVEPLASAIVLVTAIVWLLWRLDPRGGGDPVARRALGALSAMQAFALVLTAKHPDVHYLVPVQCTLGANVWLAGRYLSRHGAALVAPAAALALVAAAAINGPRLAREAARLREARLEQEATARTTDELVRGGCFAISAYRASSQQEALQWGNITAQYRGRPVLGREIARRFQRAAFDEGHLNLRNADWEPIDLKAILSSERCVIYSVETASAPAPTATVTVERVASSGIESVYRLRLAR